MASILDKIKALERFRNRPRDKVGIAGEVGVTGIGMAAGCAAAGKIAGCVGATTLLGSSTLGSVLGGVFVATTPVGWVIGSAVAAGTIAYGASKLVRSGGKNDEIKNRFIKDMEDDIERTWKKYEDKYR